MSVRSIDARIDFMQVSRSEVLRIVDALLLRRFQRQGVIPQDADVAQLATGFVAAVQGGYLLAQTSRDVTPMASAIGPSEPARPRAG